MTALTAIVLGHLLASREALGRRDFEDIRDFGDLPQPL
jgi:hypothetical protein